LDQVWHSIYQTKAPETPCKASTVSGNYWHCRQDSIHCALAVATCAATAKACLETSDPACGDLHYKVFHNKSLQELNTRIRVGIILQFTMTVTMWLALRFYYCFKAKQAMRKHAGIFYA